MRYEYAINVDHGQIFVENEGAWTRVQSWSDRPDLDLIWTAPGIIAIETSRAGGNTRLVLETADDRPNESFEAWDHVVECGIDVPSGRIKITTADIGDSPEAPRVSVPPRPYRALVFYGDLDAVDPEDDYVGNDHYRIVLWPGEIVEPIVLKRDMKRYEAALQEQGLFREQLQANLAQNKKLGKQEGGSTQAGTTVKLRGVTMRAKRSKS